MTLVSANVIHQPAVAKFHRRPGVIMPHLFDFTPASAAHEHDEWRESTLPHWKNVLTSQWQQWLHHAGRLPGASDDKNAYSITTKTKPKTSPFSTSSSSSSSATERYTWVSQAQQHNSFLHHLDRGDLQRYKFPLWKNPPEEISGAFVCAAATDMAALIPATERKSVDSLSIQSQKAHTIIDGKGVVSHYDGMTGLDGLDSTGVLERYRRYALENICPRMDS